MTEERMIVKVAKAISEAQGTTDWPPFVVSARAALLAMREPTLEMLEAALPGLPDWGTLPDEWKMMIDYAISEIQLP